MASRMGDQVERFKDFRSRRLPGQLAQLTLAGVVALVVLVAAVVALPRSKTDIAATGGTTTGVGTAPGDNLSGVPSATDVGGATSAGSGSVTGRRGTTGGTAPGQTSTRIGGAPAAPPGVNARGVTKNEILVGAAYDKNQGALNSAYGFAGIGQVETKRATETIVKYINARGGIGGRKIKLVWVELDQLTDSQETAAEKACTKWTQDNHVYAALTGGTETLDTCLHKAGVVEISTAGGLTDSQTYKKYPYLIEVDGPALDRLARFYVDELVTAGFYKRGRTDPDGAALGKMAFKLGVVSWDDPVFVRAVKAFREQLGKHKLKLSEVAHVKRYQSAGEIQDSVAGIQAAVVRFKAMNVTHVQFLSTNNAFEQLTFWQYADRQQYYPRYGISSQDAAQALKATLSAAEDSGSFERTFKQSLGVGWNPLFDVPRADYSGNKELPALRRCKQILSYETYDDPARNKEAIAAILCDPLFYLKAAIEKGGRVVNQRNWLYGVANVGKLPSALTFDMQTTAERHDGMGAIRHFAYGNDGNFHYTSGIKPV